MQIRVAKLIILYFWNHLECECNDQGSINMSCSYDGMCTCKENVIGYKCDICKPGYLSFPDCKGEIFYNLC